MSPADEQIDIPFPEESCALITCVLPAGHLAYTLGWHSDGRVAWTLGDGRRVSLETLGCVVAGCRNPTSGVGLNYCLAHRNGLETTLHVSIARIEQQSKMRRPRRIAT